MPLLQQFWTLSKSDYKSEVFKIINESSFHLAQEHIDYLFAQITETPAAKLGMEEFDALSNLGKFSRDYQFQARTSDFFWRIITDSDEHKPDLIENCTAKFSDMIKYKTMESKQPYFDKLVEQLQGGRSSAVPVIRLFKKIIRDQKAKVAYSGGSGTGTGGTGYGTTGGTTYSRIGQGTQGVGGSANRESIYPNSAAGSAQGGTAAEDEKEDPQ